MTLNKEKLEKVKDLEPVLTIETKTGPLHIMPVITPPTEEDYQRYYKALYELMLEE